jgi:glyoxylase-like metal-dependent hydrolase (beta-lactamase superfamily II)
VRRRPTPGCQELDATLARRELTRGRIDLIVCTHIHRDHVEDIGMFPPAEIVMHLDELSAARSAHRNDFACAEWIDPVLARWR